MTEEEENERDPNDPVKISFVITHEMAPWFDDRLATLREYDPYFYVTKLPARDGYLYQISTTQRHIRHNEYKKFMFQVKLKLGKDVKIR